MRANARARVSGSGPGASSERERRNRASGSAVSRKIGDGGAWSRNTDHLVDAEIGLDRPIPRPIR